MCLYLADRLDVSLSLLASILGISLKSLHNYILGKSIREDREKGLKNLFFIVQRLDSKDESLVKAFIFNQDIVIDEDDEEDGVCSILTYIICDERNYTEFPEELIERVEDFNQEICDE